MLFSDPEGHLRNAACQRLDDQRAVIFDNDDDVTAADAQAVGDNVQAARPRTLADYNHPDQYYANISDIRPPAIQRNDFELKPQYFTLAGHTPYCGLPHEHLMDHLEWFEDLVSAINANGQLPPASLTSWIEVKNTFLRNFFDEGRAKELRRKIATFTHGPMESFTSSWMRFKSYQRDCPHHGFNEVHLLSTFFRRITLAYQMALDTVSERNFNTRNPKEAVRLINNLASSNNTKNIDFERKISVTTLGKEQLDDVKAKLNSVYKLLKKHVSFAKNVDVDSDKNDEKDVNFISDTDFQNQQFT
ncbi:hypothetical protein YC2023_004770 [Brassica napus]